MNFNLIPDFDDKEIQKEIDAFLNRVEKVTQNELMQVGLKFVERARLKTKSQGGFDDQTGNLRSSIGFILLKDGQMVYENYEASRRGTDKATGVAAGREYAEKLGQDYKEGWVIITVAGMEYASWVQARGYDVIEGSTLTAEKELREAFKHVLEAFK